MNTSNEAVPVSGGVTRRVFLQTSMAATAAGALTSSMGRVFAAGSDRIRVGLIGCGARGIGAAMNCVISSPGVEIAAMGDVFADRVEAAYTRLKDNTQGREWSCSVEWTHADRVTATRDHCFTGFDAYRQVIGSGVDLVLLAGPPHFRPRHLKAAIEAGKHVFMEKPVGVDPAGVRSILTASEQAKQKGLGIAAGTQRRHQRSYIEVMKRVRDGAIGEVLGGDCFWNGGCVRHYGFYHRRQPGWTDMEDVLRNWYFHRWLSGDHICEQHVHNLDVINWAIGAPPVEAIGVGGRQWRVEPQFGDIWDHFGVRYRYANGAIVSSTCRQIDGTQPLVTESVVGSRGRARSGVIEGPNAWRWDGPNPNPYEETHANLIRSIRAGTPLNEGRAVAEATLTAILGRMSAYTGQTVRWEWVLRESELDLTPDPFKVGYRLGPAPRFAPATGHDELI
jgi:myo-inositol 2-dehydrogenase / D-chiro-inositol 1-dehydrogenase